MGTILGGGGGGGGGGIPLDLPQITTIFEPSLDETLEGGLGATGWGLVAVLVEVEVEIEVEVVEVAVAVALLPLEVLEELYYFPVLE